MAKAKIYILHGWAVDPENEQKWSVFRQFLEEKDIETEFLGLPGLTTTLSESWTLADYVAWLDSKLPEGESVILLGHSFGGQLAIRFASLYPDKISKLILIDSAGIRDTNPLVVAKRAIFLVLAKIGSFLTKSPIARTLLYKVIQEKDYLEASPTLRATMRSVLHDQVLKDLPKIASPTLIVWGKFDSQTPLRLGKKFHAMIVNSEFKVIESARHSPQFTHPAMTAQVINTFIENTV
ncbi:MAG: alpha/beta hydrolase [Microgenomates group bacterium]